MESRRRRQACIIEVGFALVAPHFGTPQSIPMSQMMDDCCGPAMLFPVPTSALSHLCAPRELGERFHWCCTAVACIFRIIITELLRMFSCMWFKPATLASREQCRWTPQVIYFALLLLASNMIHLTDTKKYNMHLAAAQGELRTQENSPQKCCIHSGTIILIWAFHFNNLVCLYLSEVSFFVFNFLLS